MKKPEDLIIVIFGASGDLTSRKLIPALFNLYLSNSLPAKMAVLGVGRTHYTDDEFRKKVIEFKLKEEQKSKLEAFKKILFYQELNSADSKSYKVLSERLKYISDSGNILPNILYYLSTPPSLYEPIAKGISAAGLNKEDDGYKRMIIEKPFGYDLQSAIHLNEQLHACFDENQIYRIDHYLGKETVQNLLVTRFSNSIFEPLWNRNYIHHIEISSSESLGVENRGGYYDSSGALRDMIQNHLLNLVALVAMEPPVDLSADAIRNETNKVFNSFRPFSPDDLLKNVIRGQYVNSHIRGEFHASYRSEPGVNENSMTETFVALKFYIDNWRWSEVPFYIRTGKKLPTRVTEVVVHFKKVPQYLFDYKDGDSDQDNMLVFRIQPDEGVLLKFGMKVPGSGFKVKSVNMDYHYNSQADSPIPEAYERLLLDAIIGDATLYLRSDAVEKAWAFVNPILKAWKEDDSIKMYGYPAGSWGPENTDDLIEGEKSTWRYPCKNLSDDGLYCEL